MCFLKQQELFNELSTEINELIKISSYIQIHYNKNDIYTVLYSIVHIHKKGCIFGIRIIISDTSTA